MIRHDQFLQDIGVVELMYSSCADVLCGGKPKHPTWCTVMLEGPMDQLRQTLAEMHEYLRLPASLPDAPLPADGDEVLPPSNRDDFRLALERLQRLYRVAGALRAELAVFRPRLCAHLLQEMLPQISACHKALRTYLRWDEMEKLSAEMERTMAKPAQAAPPVASTHYPDEKTVT